MVTHDFLIENGFTFRQFEGSTKDSYAGEYDKMFNENGLLLITLFKYSEKENDFTDILLYVTYKGQEIKVRRHMSPLTKDIFISIINIATT